jgi:molybdopterin converting factor small subunit
MAVGTIRYWAGARAAAGTSEEAYDGATLAEVLAAARDRRDAEFARVVSSCSFLVQGTRADPDKALADGDVIEVLPPFAGG